MWLGNQLRLRFLARKVNAMASSGSVNSATMRNYASLVGAALAVNSYLLSIDYRSKKLDVFELSPSNMIGWVGCAIGFIFFFVNFSEFTLRIRVIGILLLTLNQAYFYYKKHTMDNFYYDVPFSSSYGIMEACVVLAMAILIIVRLIIFACSIIEKMGT